MTEVKAGDEKLKAVPEFRYLGDMFSDRGRCKLAVVTRFKYVSSTSPSHQLLSAISDPHSGTLNMSEKFDAACNRDLVHDSTPSVIMAAS